MTIPGPDEVAACVLDTFAALPQKYKPRLLANGQSEWVPLAGIVLSRDHGPPPHLLCAALATGMKCLPHSKLPFVKGNVLHDWHAEVLALRAFNRFLIDECAELVRQGRERESKWVEWTMQEQASDQSTSSKEQDETRYTEQDGGHAQRYTPPFTFRPDVKIHMYCSETPCGDASMELTMAEQEDATPWSAVTASNNSSSNPATTSPPTPTPGLLGRGHFDRLGLVRRKPSRPDAPPTLSKSCSDKLALKQCTGLLSGPTSLLLDPGSVYLDTLILPESQYVQKAAERAFGREGRMQELGQEDIQARWRRDGGFAFRPFEVKTTKREFEFSRRSPATAARGGSQVSSNLSAMYTPGSREILINGVLQGRKQLDPRAASCVSRRMVWKSVLDVAMLAGISLFTEALRKKRTYAEMKGCNVLEGRARVKKDVKEMALKGWVRNEGDEAWELDE
ncbi:trna-specific adenosine deaminase like protein [Zymoseptoria brevis]|uniref:Trna-specific adenosine deaminase like protein n=1 Tax=Zymoseptoria brevis TaxID=1047168 RepID=A0A0F4GII7_9PEZI|nr:trna-specific adenosine deaminase like protein [Zymoseptoria brevis]